jgi:hypothetical protein
MTIETNQPPVADGDTPPPRRRAVTIPLPSGRSALRALLAVVFAALIATVVIESVHIHNEPARPGQPVSQPIPPAASSLDALRESAVTAATGYATTFATFDYRHLSQDFAATEAHAAEPFLSEYKKETASLRRYDLRLKTVSTGKVLSAGVVSVTSTSAVVDLFVDQTTMNSARSKSLVQPQRMEMTLTRGSANSEWKISKILLL